MNDMVKIITADGEQLLPLPAGFRFKDGEVFLRREGNRVVLESAEDAIDPETGLTIARLRALIQEGLDSECAGELDMDAIKREARALL